MRLSDINDIEDVSSSSNNQIYEPAEAYKDKETKSLAKNDSENTSNNSTNQISQKKNTNLEVRRAVTIVRNPSLKSSSSASTSMATNPPAANSNTLTFNSNSLPRARTPTSNFTSNELSVHSSKPIRPTAISGTNAVLTNLNNHHQQHTSTLSTTSTQYHPIANNLTNNLVKNSTLTKKKPVFY